MIHNKMFRKIYFQKNVYFVCIVNANWNKFSTNAILKKKSFSVQLKNMYTAKPQQWSITKWNNPFNTMFPIGRCQQQRPPPDHIQMGNGFVFFLCLFQFKFCSCTCAFNAIQMFFFCDACSGFWLLQQFCLHFRIQLHS